MPIRDGTAIAQPKHSHSTAIAKETKGNVIEKEDKDYSNSNTDTKEQSFSFTTSLRPRPDTDSHIRAQRFSEALMGIIKPTSQSDRICFNNITSWLMAGCVTGRFNEQIFGRVLDYAKEASRGRNHAAVFISLLKKKNWDTYQKAFSAERIVLRRIAQKHKGLHSKH